MTVPTVCGSYVNKRHGGLDTIGCFKVMAERRDDKWCYRDFVTGAEELQLGEF
jgi:hypothetical protein